MIKQRTTFGQNKCQKEWAHPFSSECRHFYTTKSETCCYSRIFKKYDVLPVNMSLVGYSTNCFNGAENKEGGLKRILQFCALHNIFSPNGCLCVTLVASNYKVKAVFYPDDI